MFTFFYLTNTKLSVFSLGSYSLIMSHQINVDFFFRLIRSDLQRDKGYAIRMLQQNLLKFTYFCVFCILRQKNTFSLRNSVCKTFSCFVFHSSDFHTSVLGYRCLS